MAMDKSTILKDLQDRIARLEQVLLGKRQRMPGKADPGDFKGATGGVRLLTTKGYFNRKRTFGEIKEALASHGYHYSKQAIQTPLNKLSKPGSLLVSFREGGRKVYAKRK